jgi:hypothetical protein
MKGNAFINQAESQGRDYITPEDVSDVIVQWAADGIRMNTARQLLAFDFLKILAGRYEFGIEDKQMCAYCLLEIRDYEARNKYPTEPPSETATQWVCRIVGFREKEKALTIVVLADSVHQACRRAANQHRTESQTMGSYRMLIEFESSDGQPLVYMFNIVQGIDRVLHISEPKQFVVNEGRNEIPVLDSVCISPDDRVCAMGRPTIH